MISALKTLAVAALWYIKSNTLSKFYLKKFWRRSVLSFSRKTQKPRNSDTLPSRKI